MFDFPDFLEQLPDGTVVPEETNTVIPQCVLKEVWMLRRQDVSMSDIVQHLQPRTVPPGYAYHTWTEGGKIKLNCSNKHNISFEGKLKS